MAVHVKKGVLPGKKKQGSKQGTELVVHQVNLIAPNRTRQTVSEARTAHRIAEFIHNPNRVALYDLFEDIMIDPNLTGVIGKRMRKVRNKGLRLVNDGKHLEEFDTLIRSTAFRDLRKYIFNTIMWGLTGIEFIPGNKLQYKLIPRKHIKPHLGIISRDQHGSEGWSYVGVPNIWVMQSNEEDNNFGLLLKAIPYILFKRHGFVNWSQFVEIYGQPLRVGKYSAYDVKTREQLEQALEMAGSSLAIMIPKEADIEFKDGKSTNSDGKLQKEFINACDEQVNILILGVTETTKSSDSSGYAQSETHADQELEVTQDDMENELQYLNEPDFITILNSYGYNIPEGAEFEHTEEADLKWLAEKLDVDERVAAKVPIAADYWYETYKIPKPDNPEDIAMPGIPDDEEEAEGEDTDDTPPDDKPDKPPKPGAKQPEKKKRSLSAMLASFFAQASLKAGHSTIDVSNLYTSRCSICGGAHQPVAAMDDEFTAITRRIAQMLYDGKVTTGYIDDKLYRKTADMLMQGVYKGMGGNTFDYFDSRNELATYFQHNVFAFSAAKGITEMQHFNSLMTGADGQIVSRSAFINAVSDAGYKFNKNYLATEYDTAYSSAQTAMEFNSFGEDDVLQISTAGDANVRPEHQILDGFTALKSDAIWQKLCPPFDYYCRCRIVPGVASRITQGNSFALIRNAEIPKYFQRNTATDKAIFTDGHPYYQKVGSKLKDFTAVGNYNMPTVKQLYIDNDFPAPALLESKEAANAWWTEKAGMLRGHIDVQDNTGVTVRFSNNFRNHVFEDNTDNRWKHITNIEDIIKNPDEVWSIKEGGILKKSYLKYYEGFPVMIKVDGVEAATFYPLEIAGKINEASLAKIRRGALLQKK